MINTDRIITTITTTPIVVVIVALIAIIMLSSNNSVGQFFTFTATVYGQSIINTTTNSNTSNNSTLPVLLVHGYMADASVWNKWMDLLKKDGIPAVYPITFKQSDDKCGSAAEHAKELSKIIGQIK